MPVVPAAIVADVERLGRIKIIPSILELVCKATGMGFAAVARVTDEVWVACGVRDEIRFGLMPGDTLELDTTICHEIRQSGHSVVIEHVAKDAQYCLHATPALYGFQSYISMPIVRRDGRFFGTLCSIDPSPAVLNTPAIVGMFRRFAYLLSLHLDATESLLTETIDVLESRTDTVLKELLTSLSGDQRPVTKSRIAAQLEQSAYKTDALIQNLEEIVTIRQSAQA